MIHIKGQDGLHIKVTIVPDDQKRLEFHITVGEDPATGMLVSFWGRTLEDAMLNVAKHIIGLKKENFQLKNDIKQFSLSMKDKHNIFYDEDFK